MKNNQTQNEKTHLVLVGGGHAHVGVLDAWAKQPIPGVRLTLISPGADTYYSGMLPGCLARDYSIPEIRIDLDHLALKANITFYRARVLRVDPKLQILYLDGLPELSYDFVSFDIGSVGKEIPGIRIPNKNLALLPTRPFSHLLACLEEWDRKIPAISTKKKILCVGGGAAAWEMILTLQCRYKKQVDQGLLEFAIVSAKPFRSPKMEKILIQRGIQIENETRVENILEHEDSTFSLETGHGREFSADFLIWAAGPAPNPLFLDSGLASSRGYLWVNEYLQSLEYKNIFGAGDCIDIKPYPEVDKAGVFAVRESPILIYNLRAAIEGRALQKYKPQKNYLRLLNTGDCSALLQYAGIEILAPWLWDLKNYIDKKFMNRFQIQALPPMENPNCGACGAKVSGDILYNELKYASHDDISIGTISEQKISLSIDHFKNFSINLNELGELAAHHALNDFYAKSQLPIYAQLNIILKKSKNEILANDFRQVMAGIKKVFAKDGIEIIGGQTTLGEEEAVGISLIGGLNFPLWKKQGLQGGDSLILTKALGTGIILAARMRYAVGGGDFEKFLSWLLANQKVVSQKLRSYPISAATDITGFGFCGHLFEMLGLKAGERVEQKVKIFEEKVPILDLAKKLSAQGYQSRMQVENQRAFPMFVKNSILYDPQTAGGVLFGIPKEYAKECILDLRKIAPESEIVGEVL